MKSKEEAEISKVFRQLVQFDIVCNTTPQLVVQIDRHIPNETIQMDTPGYNNLPCYHKQSFHHKIPVGMCNIVARPAGQVRPIRSNQACALLISF